MFYIPVPLKGKFLEFLLTFFPDHGVFLATSIHQGKVKASKFLSWITVFLMDANTGTKVAGQYKTCCKFPSAWHEFKVYDQIVSTEPYANIFMEKNPMISLLE